MMIARSSRCLSAVVRRAPALRTRSISSTATPANLLDFRGKVALVTGGSTGIGRATAIAFAHQGAKVVIGDVNNEANETVRLIKAAGGDALFVPTDVTKSSQVEALVAKTVQTYGGLHCAFNNAGVVAMNQNIADMDDAVFDRVLDVDLKGVYLCLKHEIRHMLKAGGGSIVNTASIAGLVGFGGIGSYVAAKHGVIGLSKAAAIEYGQNNIRVNVLAPGVVETPMTKELLDNPAAAALYKNSILLRRSGKPEEMTGIVLYLCSSLGSFATGQVFTIDGGQISKA